MRQIAEIWHLNLSEDIGEIRILSPEKYNEKISFKPSLVQFVGRRLEKIHLTFVDNGNYELRKFDFFKDKDLLNTDFFRSKNISFSFTSNRNENKIIIDYQLYLLKGVFEKLERLKAMIDRVDHYTTPVKLVNSMDVSKLVKEYKVSYEERGSDKSGGKSTAHICISTHRPYQIDDYLKKLLPEFNLTIASGSDFDYNCSFSSEILFKMEDEIGKDRIESIRNVCDEITNNIQRMAMLLYNESEHAESIRREYHNEYSRLLNKC